MPFSFAIVCEAAADRETACGLADRVIDAKVDWIAAEVRDAYRLWRGLEASDPYLAWMRVPILARQSGIRAHGHFAGEPGAPDAHAARLALLLLHGSSRLPDAILLIRDDDGDTHRRQGLDQARRSTKLTVPIVIGLAHTKRECWVLAGFESSDEEEENCLRTLRQELGFDPCSEAGQLTAKHDHDKRSAKRVLSQLTQGIREREAECWLRTSLPALAGRGKETGLAEYLEEVRTRLVPLLRPA